MSGGFAWSLNPDSVYSYNPQKGTFKYGLYADKDWTTYNRDYADALRKFQGSGPIYCVNVSSAVDDTGSVVPPTVTDKTLGLTTTKSP
jgi:hypothetical protein